MKFEDVRKYLFAIIAQKYATDLLVHMRCSQEVHMTVIQCLAYTNHIPVFSVYSVGITSPHKERKTTMELNGNLKLTCVSEKKFVPKKGMDIGMVISVFTMTYNFRCGCDHWVLSAIKEIIVHGTM